MTPIEYLQEQVVELKSDVKRLYDEIIILKNLIENMNNPQKERENKAGGLFVQRELF